MTKRKTNPHAGSTLDSFLAEQGVLEEFRAVAVKETIAYQIQKEMERAELTKDAMAKKMQTSRSQLDRLLDPQHPGVTLTTLQRAANVLGKDIRIELTEATPK